MSYTKDTVRAVFPRRMRSVARRAPRGCAAAAPSLRFRDRIDRKRKKEGENDEVDGMLGFVSQVRPPVFHSLVNRPARKDW